MHFHILVEDQSGEKLINTLIPKIIGEKHTFETHSYKGIGRIPKNLKAKGDPQKRILLDQLPRLLRGYDKTFAHNITNYPVAIILVCDLDNKNLDAFLKELFEIRDACPKKIETRFCIAIEEGEAWLLGDIQAIKVAYPKAKANILDAYINDSICGTWERLADAVYPGGSATLFSKGWQSIGAEKSQWAEKIAPHMDVENNASPSFMYFREKLRELAK